MNSYKDSGVEWIGEMPKYWKVKKNQTIGNEYKKFI